MLRLRLVVLVARSVGAEFMVLLLVSSVVNAVRIISPMQHQPFLAQLQLARPLAISPTARLIILLVPLRVRPVLLATCLMLLVQQPHAMPITLLQVLPAPRPLLSTLSLPVPAAISWDLAPPVVPIVLPVLPRLLAAVATMDTGSILLPILVALLSAHQAAPRVPLPPLALSVQQDTTKRALLCVRLAHLTATLQCPQTILGQLLRSV